MNPTDSVLAATGPYLITQAVPSLIIVSASRLLYEGLTMALGQYVEFVVAAIYDGAVLPEEKIHGAHMVLLDGNLRRQRIFSWLTYWRTQQIPSVVLELPDDPSTIVDYLQAGASAYCLQGVPVAEVAATVRSVFLCSVSFSAAVTTELCSRLWTLGTPGKQVTPELALTPRELEILRCVAAGMSNQEIADTLVIHILTVKNHVHNILRKLNLSRRWDAARFAMEAGLTVDPTEDQ